MEQVLEMYKRLTGHELSLEEVTMLLHNKFYAPSTAGILMGKRDSTPWLRARR